MNNTEIKFSDLIDGEFSIDAPTEIGDGIANLNVGDTLSVSTERFFKEGIEYAQMENGKYILLDKDQFELILKDMELYKAKCSQLGFDCKKYENKLNKKSIVTYSKRKAQINQIYILSDALNGYKNSEICRIRGVSPQSVSRVLAVHIQPGMTDDERKKAREDDLARLRKIYDRDVNRTIIFGPFGLVEEWYDLKVAKIMGR